MSIIGRDILDIRLKTVISSESYQKDNDTHGTIKTLEIYPKSLVLLRIKVILICESSFGRIFHILISVIMSASKKL